MRHDGPDEVKDEAESRSDSEWRPPDANHQPNRPGKLTRCQERKVLQRDDDCFVGITFT
jgi:hypothetical protein